MDLLSSTRRRASRALLLAIVTSGSLAPAVALADAPASTPSAAQGKEKFLAGAKAYREGRYKEAIDLFRQADAIDPHPEMLFNMGQAYEKLGDLANALSLYRQYLRVAGAAPDRAAVEASVKALERRLLDRGLQKVSVQSTPPGGQLDLDGTPVGQTPWTGELPPGRHVLVVHKSGYADVAKEVMFSGDGPVDIHIVVDAAALPATVSQGPVAPVPTLPVPAPPPTEKPARRSVSVLTLVTLGVGVAGLGTAVGLEAARASANAKAKSDPTQVGYANDLSSMTTYQTAARVTVGLASAVTVAGIVLLALDLKAPSAASPSAPSAAVRFGCFTTTCGTTVRGAF